jgi:hypothetical protein
MSLIVNSNLAAATVTYNGVQFGGADATYKSLPPFYALNGVYRYDESNRAVIAVDYTLQVSCVFFEASEAAMATNMAAIRKALSEAGGKLTIAGVGLGFNTSGGGIITADTMNGPKPRRPMLNAIAGQLAWELGWTVEFSLSECGGSTADPLAFLAFNFKTTWQNDFEGLCARTISGHVVIPQFRDPLAPSLVAHVADEARNSVIIAVPPNFKRVVNVWEESMDKSRLNFTVADEQIGGDFLPPGITEADGEFDFGSADQKGGLSTGIASLSMSMTTAPDQPRNLAGQIFLAAALSKQSEIITGMANAVTAAAAEVPPRTIPAGSIVPVNFRISNGKFSRARETRCSIAWMVTQTLSSLLNATGIWTPVGGAYSPNDYTLWKASMASLWGNRGFSGIGSVASEATIIDLCDNVTSKTIGVVGSSPNSPTPGSLPSLTCPDIPDDGGWLYFSMTPHLLRRDKQTQHKKAASYLPNIGGIFGNEEVGAIEIEAPTYSQSASDEHVTEYHGYPETQLAVQFVGLRFKHMPFFPGVKTVGGLAARHLDTVQQSPRVVFDAFNCPVYLAKAVVYYSVSGYVSKLKVIGSPTSASVPTVPQDL